MASARAHVLAAAIERVAQSQQPGTPGRQYTRGLALRPELCERVVQELMKMGVTIGVP